MFSPLSSGARRDTIKQESPSQDKKSELPGETTMTNQRIIGEYPAIGIRPTIDGRRGALRVRESLEDQTMRMAESAARLLRENLRYANGEPVRVIIADTRQ